LCWFDKQLMREKIVNEKSKINHTFQTIFNGKSPPLIIRSPGRASIVGAHVDYNDGFVLPMAINRSVWMAVRPRDDQKVKVVSKNRDGIVEFALDSIDKGGPEWGEYIKGVAWAMQESGLDLRGWEGVINADLPIGAGLSSSAALELAAAKAFSTLSEIPCDNTHISKLCHRAEREWVGMRCGIMDQLCIASSKPGHALSIDCRSQEMNHIPLPSESTVIILDTTTRRELVDSQFNERRLECEVAAKNFGVKALRDVNYEMFTEKESQMDPGIAKRAKHIITENERVLSTIEAMKNDDAVKVGRLMYSSYESIKNNYDASSEALDCIVDCSVKMESCYGAGITGAGFAGCAIALVRKSEVKQFISEVSKCYNHITGMNADIYECKPIGGVSLA